MPHPPQRSPSARERVSAAVRRLVEGETLGRRQLDRLVRRLQHLGPEALEILEPWLRDENARRVQTAFALARCIPGAESRRLLEALAMDPEVPEHARLSAVGLLAERGVRVELEDLGDPQTVLDRSIDELLLQTGGADRIEESAAELSGMPPRARALLAERIAQRRSDAAARLVAALARREQDAMVQGVLIRAMRALPSEVTAAAIAELQPRVTEALQPELRRTAMVLRTAGFALPDLAEPESFAAGLDERIWMMNRVEDDGVSVLWMATRSGAETPARYQVATFLVDPWGRGLFEGIYREGVLASQLGSTRPREVALAPVPRPTFVAALHRGAALAMAVGVELPPELHQAHHLLGDLDLSAPWPGALCPCAGCGEDLPETLEAIVVEAARSGAELTPLFCADCAVSSLPADEGMLGRALLAEKRFGEALALLEAARSQQPEDMSLWVALADCLDGLGQPGRALDLLREAVERRPNDAQLRARHSLSAQSAGLLQEAAHAAQAAVRASAQLPEAQRSAELPSHAELEAQAQALRGQARQAHPHLDEETALGVERGMLAGAIAMRRGQLRRAAKAFEQVLRLDERAHLAHANLGVCLAKQRRYRAARKHLLYALHLRPDFGPARENLALLDRGQIDGVGVESLTIVFAQPS